MLAKTTNPRVRCALALLALCLLPTALAPVALADADLVDVPRLPALPFDLCALPGVVWSLNTGTVGPLLGTDVKGTPAAAESKWVLSAAPAGVTLADFVVNDYPGWLNSNSYTSRWVSPVQTAGNAGSGAPAGNYQYDMKFFTYCAKRATLRFCYAADNRVAFKLNGATIVPVPAYPASQFKALTCVYFGVGLVPFGLNTLSAIVTNDNGPTGLFVTGGSTS